MTEICVPVVAKTYEEACNALARAKDIGAGLAELRLDFFSEQPNIKRLVETSPLSLIITCRPAREGGHFQREESERIRFLQAAVDAGAAYVDIEADCVNAIKRKGTTRIIASHHDFATTPSDLHGLVKRIADLPCDVVKIATMATGLADNIRLFDALQNCEKPVIGICMGELGEMSRILAPRFGSILTFGALEPGSESAPGQFTARDLVDLYRVKSLSGKTALYGVVGDPIAHSLSPEIHNSAFAELGIDAVYLRFRVADFPRFLEEIAEPLGLRGLSVTIPHKHAALAAADPVEPLARNIGAVNTLTRTETGWHGDNTDCAAALGAIRNAAERAGLAMNNARALLLGAGGTARAIGFGLINAGCTLTLANRTRSRAEALANDLRADIIDLAEAHTQEFDIVANTTSVGMHPNTHASPIDPAVFRSGMVAFDAVYNPRETRLLADAKAAGAETADGVEMFVGQAVRQFERWCGVNAPRDVMERIVVNRLAGNTSS